ncbi:MAG: WD40/YVTN/BNR-like repeat-containing protein [Acidimicrobiales bacterium]
MAQDYAIGVSTVGFGLHFTYNKGEKWRHIFKPIWPENNVRTIRVSPSEPQTIWAGVDRDGIYRSFDNGYRWEKVPSPIEDCEIWSLAIDPVDPNRVYVGARPDGWRTADGGATWEKMDMGVNPKCPIGVPRITNMLVDPRDRDVLWAGVEVDGMYRSADGGDTWSAINNMGPDAFYGDVHGLAVAPGSDGAATVYCASPFGLAISTDEGASWTNQEFPGFDEGSKNPYAYCRGVFVKPGDPQTVLVGTGDFIPGQVGRIQLSRDGGKTWDAPELPVKANSTVYWMAMSPEVPDVIVAATIYGQVFLSENSGESWDKLAREFGEIRCVSLSPA